MGGGRCLGGFCEVRMISFPVSMSKIGVLGCVLCGFVSVASAQESYFDKWPAGVAPREVGEWGF
jgi:hypothetical protein